MDSGVTGGHYSAHQQLGGQHLKSQIGRGDGGINGPDAVKGLHVERRDDHLTTVLSHPPPEHQPGHRSRHLVLGVVVGIVGRALDLDVDHKLPLGGRGPAHIHDLGQRRHPVGQFIVMEFDDGPAVGQVGVVVHNQHVVGRPPHVEFDSVGMLPHRLAKRLQGVLALHNRRPAMGNHPHRTIPTRATRLSAINTFTISPSCHTSRPPLSLSPRDYQKLDGKPRERRR